MRIEKSGLLSTVYTPRFFSPLEMLQQFLCFKPNIWSSLLVKWTFSRKFIGNTTYFMTPGVIICVTFLLCFCSLIVTAAGTPYLSFINPSFLLIVITGAATSPLSSISPPSFLLIVTAVAGFSFPPPVFLFLTQFFVSFGIIIVIITAPSFSVSVISWLASWLRSIVITKAAPSVLF